MTRKDIIALPHPSLREKSTKVSRFDADLKKLINDMIEAGLDWEDHREHELCVGLAAVQLNFKQKVVILRADQDDKTKREFITMVNPKITKLLGEPELDFEGCLSVSDIYGKVPRYPKVKVKAQDENGNEFRVTADGFLARLIQHEVDHTNGLVFIDHIKDKDLFYEIDAEGKIEKLDYDESIKNSDILW